MNCSNCFKKRFNFKNDIKNGKQRIFDILEGKFEHRGKIFGKCDFCNEDRFDRLLVMNLLEVNDHGIVNAIKFDIKNRIIICQKCYEVIDKKMINKKKVKELKYLNSIKEEEDINYEFYQKVMKGLHEYEEEQKKRSYK